MLSTAIFDLYRITASSSTFPVPFFFFFFYPSAIIFRSGSTISHRFFELHDLLNFSFHSAHIRPTASSSPICSLIRVFLFWSDSLVLMIRLSCVVHNHPVQQSVNGFALFSLLVLCTSLIPSRKTRLATHIVLSWFYEHRSFISFFCSVVASCSRLSWELCPSSDAALPGYLKDEF